MPHTIFSSGRPIRYAAIACLVIAIVSALRTVWVLTTMQRIEATIIRVDRSDSERGGTMSRPTLRYTGPDGREYTREPMFHRTGVYEVGSSIEILIDPDDPARFWIPSMLMWWLPIIAGGGTVIFGALARGVRMVNERQTARRS